MDDEKAQDIINLQEMEPQYSSKTGGVFTSALIECLVSPPPEDYSSSRDRVFIAHSWGVVGEGGGGFGLKRENNLTH